MPHSDPFFTLVERCDALVAGEPGDWTFPHLAQSRPYADLVLESAVVAQWLARLGVGRADRIGLALPNGPDLAVALLALWRLGAVPVPLRPGVGGGYRDYLLAIDGACILSGLIHAGGQAGEAVAAWSAKTARPAWSIRAMELPAPGVLSPAPVPPVSLAPRDLALLQPTSGSTGSPKPTMVTHGMVATQIGHLLEGHRVYVGGPPRSLASWLPAHHDAGLFMGVLVPLAAGCDHILATPDYYLASPRRWFRLMGECGVEANFATNGSAVLACRALGRGMEVEGTPDLSRLHILFGAEKLQVEVLNRLERLAGPLGLTPGQLHCGYGMAETALGATRTEPGPIRRVQVRIDGSGGVGAATGTAGDLDLVSVGRPLPGFRLQVRDPHGAVLGQRRLGEVWIKGPCVTPGYFRNAAATARRLRGGWLATGDLGFLDGGELFFVGRADDLLNFGGVKVVPEDLEQSVEGLGRPARQGGTCLVGSRSTDGVSVPKLLVEVRPAESGADWGSWQRRARLHLAERFGLWGVALLAVPRGTLERTDTGKLRRRVLAERLAGGEIEILGFPDSIPPERPDSPAAGRVATVRG